ncbi:MAG: hypothetical protein ABI635_02945 [Actinomycetota bacterium]
MASRNGIRSMVETLMVNRRVARVIVGFLVLIQVVAGSSVAIAIDCGEEQTLFARDPNQSSSDAVRDKIFVRDRDLNDECLGRAEAHSTAHMRNTSFDKFAEAGWYEQWGPSASHLFNAFWEIGIGDTIICDSSCGPAIAPGDHVIFKVENVDGTNRWKFFFDYGANGNYVRLGPSDGTNANFGHGIPMGETGRRGGNGTGALDAHRDLERKTCESCSYTSWSTNSTFQDNITNYHRAYQAPDFYKVEHD